MRTFTDSTGTEWTVFEVSRQLSDDSGRWTYLPEGFASGWLCFESRTGKRRLVQFPTGWRQSEKSELEQLCRLARPARSVQTPQTLQMVPPPGPVEGWSELGAG